MHYKKFILPLIGGLITFQPSMVIADPISNPRVLEYQGLVQGATGEYIITGDAYIFSAKETGKDRENLSVFALTEWEGCGEQHIGIGPIDLRDRSCWARADKETVDLGGEPVWRHDLNTLGNPIITLGEWAKPDGGGRPSWQSSGSWVLLIDVRSDLEYSITANNCLASGTADIQVRFVYNIAVVTWIEDDHGGFWLFSTAVDTTVDCDENYVFTGNTDYWDGQPFGTSTDLEVLVSTPE